MALQIRRSLAVIIGAVLFAGGSIFLPNRPYMQSTAQAQVTPVVQPAAPRTITVSGSGSADVTPDIAMIDLGVTSDGKTAREALSLNNQDMQSLMTALRTAGIASADIRTSTLQLYPRYQTPTPLPNGQTGQTPNELVGFTATNSVEITVRKLDSLGQILDQAVSAGSNQIQGIRFDVSNPSEVMDQARETAMLDAKHKAQQLSTLAGAKLGIVLVINENSSRPIPYAAAGGIMAPQAASVPVSPGTQTITVDVQVTWELQ